MGVSPPTLPPSPLPLTAVSTVGKIRKRWVQETLSPNGVAMLRALKKATDPTNVFANGNLLP